MIIMIVFSSFFPAAETEAHSVWSMYVSEDVSSEPPWWSLRACADLEQTPWCPPVSSRSTLIGTALAPWGCDDAAGGRCAATVLLALTVAQCAHKIGGNTHCIYVCECVRPCFSTQQHAHKYHIKKSTTLAHLVFLRGKKLSKHQSRSVCVAHQPAGITAASGRGVQNHLHHHQNTKTTTMKQNSSPALRVMR